MPITPLQLQKKANKVAHTDRQIEILKLEAQLEDISARLVDLKVRRWMYASGNC